MTRRNLLLLLLFVVLALALTWPMAAHFGTHVPGDGIDDPALAWNLWWAKHSLVDQPQNPFDVRWQFWPVGINLAFYTLTLLNGALAIPVQAAVGLIPSYDLLLLLSYALSGFGATLLCRWWLARAVPSGNRSLQLIAASIGGILYAFASAKLFYAALGQANIASSQWIPFAILYLLRATRREGRLRDAALAALFVTLQAFAELTYASFLAIFGLLALAWGLAAAGDSRRRMRLVGRMAALAVLVVLGTAPILANMAPDLRTEGDFFTSGGGFSDLYSADLAGYVLPTQLHPLLGEVVQDWSRSVSAAGNGDQFPVDKGQQVYVGFAAMVLTALALGRRGSMRTHGFWVAATVLFFLLTLGPNVRLAGHDTGIPGPFRLMEVLPFFKGNRYPSRYAVMLLACLAPLVAAGMARLITSGRPWQRWAAVAMVGLMFFEHLSLPLPLSDLRVPGIYARVAQEEGDFALLEVPPGWRNGARVAGKSDIRIMQQLFYQTAHGKRVFGGNTSRNPEFKFQYFSEDPTLARLIATTNAANLPQHDTLREALAADPVDETDREQARRWAGFVGLRFVMVHRDKIPPATEAALLALLPLEPVAREGSLVLYRLSSSLPPPATFDVTTDEGRMALAEGWSPQVGGSPVYAQRAESRLLLPLGKDAVKVSLTLSALIPGQTLSLVVDGRATSSQPVTQATQQVDFDVPPDPSRPPVSDVRLRFSRVLDAKVLAMTISRSGPLGAVVRSAGEETGNFAHIYVNGVERSPNRRGYNMVSFDAVSGQVTSRAAFDTHADPGAGAAMAAWVAALPDGSRVAGAVRDEGSMAFDDDAASALRAVGVAGDVRGKFRWGHAFIGTKGAAPGTAAEAAGGWLPAQITEGLALTEPRLAAALYRIEIAH